MRRPGRRSGREPTIALINVVFLMLIFFMVASRIAPPIEKDLTLVRTSQLDGRPPPDTLVLNAGGMLRLRGQAVAPAELADFVASQEDGIVKIVPDRDVDARRLVAVSSDLRRAGAASVILVTEQALR